MGTQSTTTPLQARTVDAIRRRIAHHGATIALAVGSIASAPAQTQATPLGLPSAITFDARGNLYFAETGSHVIRKLSAAGVTIVAGNGVQGSSGDGGPATAAELDSPAGLALDPAGNLYIADSHNHRVREVIAATGTITTIAGTGVAGYSGDNGPATAAKLDLPTALALDSAGNLYIADANNHRVRRVAAGTGDITTIAGNGVEAFSGDNGPATSASIDSPNGLALDTAGNLYIADTHNGRVREVNVASGVITTVAGAGVAGGNVQTYGGDNGAATAAGLALPRGLTIDAAGNLYISDSANHRIRRISPAGVITTVAGQGTETFAGDGAPAIAASLDTPRSVAISPAGLLTLADTANQRIRQLDALPAPGPDIHTIAGSGSAAQETLSLTGSPVMTYGSGTLTTTLTSATLATGIVTFLDTTAAPPVTLGTISLSVGVATFSIASLSAGAHSIDVTYSGDATHTAAQSSPFALTVMPLALTAAANPASILYGQTVPSLSGILNGVLPRDAVKVAAIFTTSAGPLSPVGAYPISAALTGTAAVNYTVVLTPVNLAITQAPTLTTLSPSTTNSALGSPLTLTARAASTTSGVPTGSVTLLDGTAALSAIPLTTGGAAFTTGALGLGTHTLTVSYSGDANFLPSTSASTSVVVSAASDFSIAATGTTTQLVPAGSAATFSFSVATTGTALASPILLAAQGMPVGATASLSPTSLPPGGAAASFTLTIQTPLAGLYRPSLPLVPRSPNLPGALAVLLLPAIGGAWRPLRKGGRTVRSIYAAVLAVSTLLMATGCGNRVNTASEDVAPKSYTLTVTGTATSPSGTALRHSVVVTLKVL